MTAFSPETKITAGGNALKTFVFTAVIAVAASACAHAQQHQVMLRSMNAAIDPASGSRTNQIMALPSFDRRNASFTGETETVRYQRGEKGTTTLNFLSCLSI